MRRHLSVIVLAGSLWIAIVVGLIFWGSKQKEDVQNDVTAKDPIPIQIQIHKKSTHENPSSIIAHVVPHSHCDAAYKKTLEEYYETEVRHVINSVLEALQLDPSRRFVWAETIYLTKWWLDPRTTSDHKKLFHELLIMGQMEIVNGGWVMHDEAITRYDSQIHQMIEGHDRLQQMFVDKMHRPDVSVLTGWQIDPFGSSSFTVNLHAWAGMDFLVTKNMPANIKDQLKANQTLQFYWETPETRILVNVMDLAYESPHGFDWESLEHPSIPVTPENVRERTDAYVSVLRERATYYRTPHILIPFGGDFLFQNASWQFQNMDCILVHIRDHPERYSDIIVKYSTPRQFKEALLTHVNSKNVTLPVIHGSPFLPLWAGFYTQIPILKQMVRTCEIILRQCEVRLFQALRSDANWDWLRNSMRRIRLARETVGLMQHHDAITATSYRYVIADYMQRLSSSFQDMSGVLLNLLEGDDKPAFSTYWTKGSIVGGGPYIYETLLVRAVQNARSISLEKTLNPQMGLGGISLVVLNSLGQEVDTVVHFVCTRSDVAIVLHHDDGSEESLLSQATPLEHELDVANLGLFLISFRASIPALGKTQYRLHVCDLTWATDQHPPPLVPFLDCAHLTKELTAEDLAKEGLSSSSIQVDFDEHTSDIASFTRLYNDGSFVKSKLAHDLMLYYGPTDDIYAFRTNVESSNPPPLLGPKRRRFISAYKGLLFSEVKLEFTPWLVVRYRVTNGDSLLQVSMLSGPLPSSVNLASHFETNWTKTGWFFEENGFRQVQAMYNSSHGLGDGNCRPMVSRSWLEQENHGANRLTVFTVDPRAVVSKRSGQMDVFWHRRNNVTNAWWSKTNKDWSKEGDDMSTSRSSVWLGLSDGKHTENPSPREISLRLSNDLILLSTGAMDHSQADLPIPEPIATNMHIVSLRLSEVDKSINNYREEAWVDLQVENLSESSLGEIDVAVLFANASKLFLNGLSLYSLTYLTKVETQSNWVQPALQNDKGGDSCSLQGKDGGKRWVLSVGPRRICSVRAPVSPLWTKRDNSAVEDTW